MARDSNDKSFSFKDNVDNFLNHITNNKNSNNIMTPTLLTQRPVFVQPSLLPLTLSPIIVTLAQSTQLEQNEVPAIDLDLPCMPKGSTCDTLRKKHRNKKNNHHTKKDLVCLAHNIYSRTTINTQEDKEDKEDKEDIEDKKNEENIKINETIDIMININSPNIDPYYDVKNEHDTSDSLKKIEIVNIESDKQNDNIIFNVKHTNDNCEDMNRQDRSASEAIEEKQQILGKLTNIKDRFVVLSNLKEGYKIWITIDPVTENPSFEIDESYFPAIARRWNGAQSRENTINIIVNDTNYISKNLKKLPEHDQNRKKMSLVISAAIPGIINLKKTYAREETHEKTLSTVIEALKKYAYTQNEENN
jgi:hypothetical protein